MAPVQKQIHPPIRGVIRVPLQAGRMVAGDPLDQKGYITTQFPNGISRSELSRASKTVQQETMDAWFFRNYRAFTNFYGSSEPTSGPIQLALTAGTIGTHPQTPDPIYGYYVASAELHAEFRGAVPDAVISDLGKLLNGTATNTPTNEQGIEPPSVPYIWEIIPYLDGEPLQDSNGEIITDSHGEPITAGLSPDDLKSLVVERLLDAQATLRTASESAGLTIDAASGNPGIGHNGPPDEILSKSERVNLDISISELIALLQKPSIDPSAIATAAEPLPTFISKLRNLFRDGGKSYFQGLIKGAGTITATELFTHRDFLAAVLIHQLDDATTLINMFLRHLGIV